MYALIHEFIYGIDRTAAGPMPPRQYAAVIPPLPVSDTSAKKSWEAETSHPFSKPAADFRDDLIDVLGTPVAEIDEPRAPRTAVVWLSEDDASSNEKN